MREKMLNSMDKIDSYAELGVVWIWCKLDGLIYHNIKILSETKFLKYQMTSTIGKTIPYIDFINDDFSSWKGSPEFSI